MKNLLLLPCRLVLPLHDIVLLSQSGSHLVRIKLSVYIVVSSEVSAYDVTIGVLDFFMARMYCSTLLVVVQPRGRQICGS